MTKKRFNARPQMTAEEARTFENASPSNVSLIELARTERAGRGLYPDCQCQPYQDTFTFDRWKAQGFYVRKGEKALAGVKTLREFREDKDGKEIVKRVPWTAYVFCRCQVNASDKAKTTDESPVTIMPEPVAVESETVEPLGISDERFAALEL